MLNPTPHQPTGMNELRRILQNHKIPLDIVHDFSMPDTRTFDNLESCIIAVQQIVERCLPTEKTTVPAAADLYERAEQIGNVEGFKEAIDQFRHNLQQAGLLRGGDVTKGGGKDAGD